MEETTEVFVFDLELQGGKVQLQIPIEQKEAVTEIFSSANFAGKVLNPKTNVIIVPSKDGELNDFQFAWADFNSIPSILTLFFDMEESNLWKALNKNFNFDITDVVRKSEIFFNNKNEVIENTKYSIKLDDGIYVTFLELGNDEPEEKNIISSLSFNYDGKLYDHDVLTEKLIKAFSSSIIIQDAVKDSKVYIANYIDDEFEFEPFDIGNIKMDLRGKKKKVYEEIVSSINDNRKGTYVLHGKRGSGKTQYLRKLLKKVKKKIIYVPVDSFEYAFHNKNFFNQIKNYGECLVVFEDCELYFRTPSETNIYLSMLLRFNDSLISNRTNFNCILVFNSDNLSDLCSDINTDKISFVSMKDTIAKFDGYK